MVLKIFDKEKNKHFLLNDLISFSIKDGIIYCEFEFGDYQKEFDSKKYDIEIGVN